MASLSHWGPSALMQEAALPSRSRAPVLGLGSGKQRTNAEKQALDEQFDRLLRRHSHPDFWQLAEQDEHVASSMKKAVLPTPKQKPMVEQLEEMRRGSPYVGFQRHAPPSPVLRFIEDAASNGCFGNAVGGAFDLAAFPRLGQSGPARGKAQLPDELWAFVLSFTAEICSICKFARVARCISKALISPTVWRGRRLRLGPQVLSTFAAALDRWLFAWSRVDKLLLPSSGQLLDEIAKRAPGLNVEVQWRFDADFCAAGVEVLKRGAVVRRMADDELVVLGDAPLMTTADRAPYFEVSIDSRLARPEEDEPINDMGIGVTMCKPKDLEELGAVADEIPSSWVVDFTQSLVVLSVNNSEAAKGTSISAASLHEGDRVGLRIQPGGALEVFINGVLRESLLPPVEDRVPIGVELFPIFDLFGLTEQLSCTGAEGPSPTP